MPASTKLIGTDSRKLPRALPPSSPHRQTYTVANVNSESHCCSGRIAKFRPNFPAEAALLANERDQLRQFYPGDPRLRDLYLQVRLPLVFTSREVQVTIGMAKASKAICPDRICMLKLKDLSPVGVAYLVKVINLPVVTLIIPYGRVEISESGPTAETEEASQKRGALSALLLPYSLPIHLVSEGSFNLKSLSVFSATLDPSELQVASCTPTRSHPGDIVSRDPFSSLCIGSVSI